MTYLFIYTYLMSDLNYSQSCFLGVDNMTRSKAFIGKFYLVFKYVR